MTAELWHHDLPSGGALTGAINYYRNLPIYLSISEASVGYSHNSDLDDLG